MSTGHYLYFPICYGVRWRASPWYRIVNGAYYMQHIHTLKFWTKDGADILDKKNRMVGNNIMIMTFLIEAILRWYWRTFLDVRTQGNVPGAVETWNLNFPKRNWKKFHDFSSIQFSLSFFWNSETKFSSKFSIYAKIDDFNDFAVTSAINIHHSIIR